MRVLLVTSKDRTHFSYISPYVGCSDLVILVIFENLQTHLETHLELWHFFHLLALCLIFNSPCQISTSFSGQKCMIFFLSREFCSPTIRATHVGQVLFQDTYKNLSLKTIISNINSFFFQDHFLVQSSGFPLQQK